MLLKSTRDDQKQISALDAVLKGISSEGGLFIPCDFPSISLEEIESYRNFSYQELAAKILNMYFDEISFEDMKKLTNDAYSSFSAKDIIPLKKIDDDRFILELFHGPTLAFKDVALQVLPRLMSKSLENSGQKEDVIILTATSGDTGKAALEGFKDVDRIKIVVYYPCEGVSDMQKLQMSTQEGNNTSVYAVKGNFDDTQNGVKHIFTNEDMKNKLADEGYVLSSANSINIGRLTPQIVYYFWSYICMLNSGDIKLGDKINIVVPTGNFGNILAAYYAEKMGLPVNKFICASNTNRVLTDFFNKSEYSLKNREFVKTISPSMDILISSNLERLIADMVGDSEIVSEMFDDLKNKQKYSVKNNISQDKVEKFYANWACEARTKKAIKKTYDENGYLIDPHTAVAVRVCDDYRNETSDKTPCVIASTASPYKFSDSVLEALELEVKDDAFENANNLSEYTNTKIPDKILDLKDKEVLHKKIIEKQEMFDCIIND